ncbi:PREDICTED: retinoblastoma-like protein 1 [Calidris pugnax]|uniref:retinoblastoma-like protein 1 n=1 Tax=Calidris pugnax TaxID=198806 RepID=UPI00071D2CDA|nr:PREDICTED: retinoblastoma-like protein 1 [Calidris pugnax]
MSRSELPPAEPGAAIERLCQELNLDAASAAEALRDFTALRGTYSLEGEALHWLACALYVACRKSLVPTVGSGLMEGNGVSLTRILRSARLSLIQFFSKMKKWMDMSNLPQEFRERVERLERNFEVSTVIFKKFEPIFLDIFQNPYEETLKPQRSRKQRRMPCGIKDLFNFCWTLFVYTKGNFRMIGDDLVNSYHLLLCCLDLIFANALLCPNRRALLNPSFKGLPVDFPMTEIKASEDPPCIIATLCELHDGLLVEAKGIKEHYFKPYISKLFDRKILKGECLLDLCSFTENNKALNKEYEEYVLTVGDFDERVFLGADAEEEIGTPRKFPADVRVGKMAARAHVECHLQQHFEKKRSFAPSTPLTGRRYLREKEAIITPVASATQSVSRLQNIVAGLKNAPSEQLIAIFESCARSPMESITSRVKEIGERFCRSYTQSTDEQPGSHIDFAINRLKLAEILYYKVLETIMVQETRRLHGKDLTALLEQDVFHRSLMACCLEIVLFAYSSPRTFPWIIEVLDLRPFYFYKVIEVLIRSEEGLSRDMVKHLNSIEEQILESLAWTRDSALWNALQASENKVPTCEEVIFPNNFEASNGGSGLGHLSIMPISPIIHPRVKEVRTDLGGSSKRAFMRVEEDNARLPILAIMKLLFLQLLASKLTKEALGSCARSPMESITSRVKEIGERFCRSYTQSTDEQPGSHIDFAINRLKLAEILYYKVLETIMVQETRRLHGKDLTALLEQDVFHRSLMACCLEIVLFAYSSPRTFPWIIEVLDLRPFYFYKVIEVLIRSEEGLSRDMVKHLNSIEEQILESLAWTRDSALWNALQASENKVPTCEEVIFPNNFEASNGGSGLGHLSIMPISPIIHPRVKEVRTDLGGSSKRAFMRVEEDNARLPILAIMKLLFLQLLASKLTKVTVLKKECRFD